MKQDIRNNPLILNLSPRSLFGPFFFKRRVDEAVNLTTEKRCFSCVYYRKSAVYRCQVDVYNMEIFKDFLPGKCFYYCKYNYQTYFLFLKKAQQIESQIPTNASFLDVWKASVSDISLIVSHFCKRDPQVSLMVSETNFKVNSYLFDPETEEDSNSLIKEMEFSRAIILDLLADKKYQKSNASLTEKEIVLIYLNLIDKMLPLLLF